MASESSETINCQQATHIVRQYLNNPSKRTFKQVYVVVDLVSDILLEFCDDMDFFIEKELLIGHIFGSLNQCKDKAYQSMSEIGLWYLRDLYLFERDMGTE